MAPDLPQVRRRPTKATSSGSHRNSSAVRASVLETALELGFGQNSTVADWIFNNPLSEELEEHNPEPEPQSTPDSKSEPAPEPAEATTPTFTSGPNSVSDESSSLNSPAIIAHSAASTAIQVHTHKPSLTESPHVHFGDFSSDQLQLFSPFALSPHDAYAADSGSLTSLQNGSERSRSQDDSLRRNPSHENPASGSADAGYASEGQYLSKGKAGKTKPGKLKGTKGSRKASDNSRTSEKDGDYTSDGGYLSTSSIKSQGKSPGRVKSRAMAFFRRRPKRTASDDEDEDIIPPVPALPMLPRPSSPKPLERRAAPSSPTRPGFAPLTLNLTSPPASPPRRRASKSPPPAQARVTPPRRLDHGSSTHRSTSPPVTSTSAPTAQAPATITATVPLPPSLSGTPLPTASYAPVPAPPTPVGVGAGPTQKSLTAQSSRQHLNIPPPGPPPTLPLPQPPPSPSTSSNGALPPLPATPATPSKRGIPNRPIPVLPMHPGSTQPLTPRGTASPLRPLLSPRALPPAVSHARNGEVVSGPEGDRPSGKEITRRQPSGTAPSAGLGSTPAFLQRRIQYGPPPSPRPPPPDIPLPPSPCLTPNVRPRTPVGSPSKFHEHLSSVSSVPLSQILATPSRSPSMATLSESFSGPSVRSSHVSSASGLSEEPATLDSRQTTSSSSISENSLGPPVTSTFRRPVDLRSQSSGRSDVSSSIYTPTMPRDGSSITAYDDDADVEDAAPKSYVDEEDDDASVYPSEDKTAGRRTMYLVEHGEMVEDEDGDGDDVDVASSRFWGHRQAPPPLPPLPPKSTRPGPGYF